MFGTSVTSHISQLLSSAPTAGRRTSNRLPTSRLVTCWASNPNSASHPKRGRKAYIHFPWTMGRDKPTGRHPNAKVASPNPHFHENLDARGQRDQYNGQKANEDRGEEATTHGREQASRSQFTGQPQHQRTPMPRQGI